MKLSGSIFTILIALFTNQALFSDTNQEPVFDVSRQDIVFRRTTLIVRNIDTSLMLYQDALGMEVVYDNILTSRDGSKSRLIFLKTKDEHVGILGLWELDYGSPSSDRRNLPVERKAFVPQGNIHLFNTNEILASMLLTLHNINFYQELMSSIRENINRGTFNEFHDKYIDKL